MTHTKALTAIIDGLSIVDQKAAFSGNLCECFSALVDQQYMIDVIAVDSKMLPNVTHVLDIFHRPETCNLHEDMSDRDSKTHLATYACDSFADAIQRISSAVSAHSDYGV